MTKKLLFVMTILLVASFALMAADVSGKWTFEQPGRGGNPGRPVTMTLKADGAKLTGSMPGMGRGGGDPPPPTEITDGKVDGNNVSWSAKISSPMPLTLDFAGTVDGDKLSGSVKAGSFGSFPFTGNRTA